jgi:DNA-binding NarL/FixJ family response regulator
MLKVLIVDDSELLRQRLIEMLEELKDVEIIGQAERVVQAKNLARQLKPDSVILDLQMPDGNGIDVLRDIKKQDMSPVVIIFTNYPYPFFRKKCLEAGADFFFDKSTEFEKMFEVLKQVTNGRLIGKMPSMQ